MLKRYILVSALFTSSATAFAYKPIDSIGVENNNGKKLIIHKVDAKESYYSISRKYNVAVKDLQTFNNNASLQIGSVIKVPTNLPFLEKTAVNNGPKINTTGFFEYKIEAKDNLNLIAERYATTVAEIKRINNLNSNALQIGQVLKIPFTKNVTTTTTTNNNKPATPTNNEQPITTVASTTGEHTVKPKEYLGVIAKQYGITVDELKAANGLTSNNLSIGQVLKIPAGANQSANTVTPAANVTPVASVTEKVIQQPTNTIKHIVKADDNLNTIARQYNTTAENLKQLNALTNFALTPGQVIFVPKAEKEVKQPETKVTEVKPQEVKESKKTEVQPIVEKTDAKSFEHIVAANETIYSIAQKYKLTTYQLKQYNNLTSNDLTVGKKLIIKGEKPLASENLTSDSENTLDSTTLKSPALKRPAAVYGLNRIEEKGTAIWISDPDLDPNKMLILHRTAPVGTIIQITNPMTNRSTFAKVVGKFTENETTKDAVVVMTKAVADAVGALDKRFFCNLSYGPKENEK